MWDALLSLRPVLVAAGAALTAAVAAPAAAAQPSDAALLAAIRAQASSTTDVTDVHADRAGAHLAISTRARAESETQGHDELWLAAGDGSGLQPLSRSTGSAAEYARIASVGWSADGERLAYAFLNPAVKSSSAAHVVDVDAIGGPRDLSLGTETIAPEFTADGRYVVFLQQLSGARLASGALDLASGRILLPARIDAAGSSSEPAAPLWLAPECAHAAEPGWVPAQTTGRWLEQALASPDPGCRFGANEQDAPAEASPDPNVTPTPTPTPTPDVSGASDAPPSITRTSAQGLVTIADRVKPLGPTLRIRSSAKSITQAVRRGLRLQLEVAGAVSVKAYVIAERPTDEDLLTPSRGTTFITLGRATFRDLPSQRQTIAIPLTRDAKRGLPRFLKITVTVRLIATDRAGNQTMIERQVALTDF